VAPPPAPVDSTIAPERKTLRVTAYGRSRAIVDWRFLVDGTRGLVGFLATGDVHAFTGFDAEDRLYYAGPTPELCRYDLLQPTHARAEPCTRIDGADFRFDTVSVGAFVVYFGWDTTRLSRDDGRAFGALRIAPGPLSDKERFVRNDGIVVARAEVDAGGERTFISRDLGEHWALSPFQPKRLVQNGAWIWNGSARCPPSSPRTGFGG
jgi:hypothetical protein